MIKNFVLDVGIGLKIQNLIKRDLFPLKKKLMNLFMAEKK